MGLKITYTCNWCNKTHEMPKIEAPPEWLMHSVLNPRTKTTEEGYFCKEPCVKLYKKHESAAIVSADEHYAKEYYSFMNKMKAAECDT